MTLKPWQHLVFWPNERVLVTEQELLAAASVSAFLAERKLVIAERDFRSGCFRAIKLDSAVNVVVTEDHDSGDEQP